MNTGYRGLSAALLACSVVLLGCRSSTRSLNLGSRELKVGNSRQLCPADVLPVAGSSDGELVALMAKEADIEEARIEIRQLESGNLQGTISLGRGDDFLPLLFSKDKRYLIGAVRDVVFRLDIASGKRERTGVVPTVKKDETSLFSFPLPYPTNSDRSIIGLGTAYVLADGKVVATGSRNGESLFDPSGNAWYRKGEGWMRIDRAGAVAPFLKRPSYLVVDQGAERGPMKLTQQRVERKFKGGEALVDLIWLECKGAVGDARAALVFAGPDVQAYGFVPNKSEVYVVSEGGSFIVPIEFGDRAAASP